MIRDRVDLMVNKALEKEGAKGLTDWLDCRDVPFDSKFPASCGVRNHLLPFYVGHMEDGLAAWKKRVYEELIDKQRDDGSWAYLGDMAERVRQGDDIVDGERLFPPTMPSTFSAFSKIPPPCLRPQSATSSSDVKRDAYLNGCFFPKTSRTGGL